MRSLDELHELRELANAAEPRAATSVMPQVIDISHWQGNLSVEQFADIKAQGVLGVIMKATEGTSYVDPARRSNFVNATAAGLRCCCYFWLKPGDGAAQAKFFIDTIDPVPGERVVIDYEEDGCTIDTLKDAVQTLINHYFGPQELQVTVYSGHLLKEQLGDTYDEFLSQHTDLWLAQYTSDFSSISWPEATYPEWSLHQYSQTGVVPHIDPCDLDRFNGTDAQCLAWLSPGGREPMPGPEPEPAQPISIDISAPDGTPVEVVINGTLVFSTEGKVV